MKILSKPRYNIVGEMTRFDERENVHARYELEPETPEWETFYKKHPEWEKVDLETKALPGIGKVGHPWDRVAGAPRDRGAGRSARNRRRAQGGA